MYARYAYLLDANIASDLHRGKADIDRSAYGVANIGIKKQRIDTMHNATGNNDTYRQYRTGARRACVAYNAHSDRRQIWIYLYKAHKAEQNSRAATKTDDAQACRPSMSNRAFLQRVRAQAPSIIILSASSAINSPLVGLSLDE